LKSLFRQHLQQLVLVQLEQREQQVRQLEGELERQRALLQQVQAYSPRLVQ
jgi:hypothetical protein